VAAIAGLHGASATRRIQVDSAGLETPCIEALAPLARLAVADDDRRRA
jgi:hypothetical protein